MDVTLLVFHLEISGKDINDEHSKNNSLKSLASLIFQIEISGNNSNDEQP